MTKTQTKSRRVPIYRRPIIIIVPIILIVAIAVVVFFLLRSTKTDEPVNPSPAPVDTPIDFDDPANAENPPDKAVQYEGEDPNQLDELTGSITRRTVSGGELTVIASIDQYLSSDSCCRLILKDSSGAEVRSTDTISVDAEATSSACGPLTVSASQLSGAYTIDIVITSPDKSGHITAEINI